MRVCFLCQNTRPETTAGALCIEVNGELFHIRCAQQILEDFVESEKQRDRDMEKRFRDRQLRENRVQARGPERDMLIIFPNQDKNQNGKR